LLNKCAESLFSFFGLEGVLMFDWWNAFC
jgi:hypothetical protein